MDRVQIGTCAGPADAALVRAAFEAHHIQVVINAEQHASMLAGLGGAMVPLNIYVSAEDAEQASALLADIRAQARDATDDDESEEDAEDARQLVEIGDQRALRRRRQATVLVIILGGAAGFPFASNSPVLLALLVVACVGALYFTLRAPPPSSLPRAKLQPKK